MPLDTKKASCQWVVSGPRTPLNLITLRPPSASPLLGPFALLWAMPGCLGEIFGAFRRVIDWLTFVCAKVLASASHFPSAIRWEGSMAAGGQGPSCWKHWCWPLAQTGARACTGVWHRGKSIHGFSHANIVAIAFWPRLWHCAILTLACLAHLFAGQLPFCVPLIFVAKTSIASFWMPVPSKKWEAGGGWAGGGACGQQREGISMIFRL